MSRVAKALEELSAAGMKVAVLAAHDGLLIETLVSSAAHAEPEIVAALGASALDASKLLADDLLRPWPDSILVEFEHGGIIVQPIAQGVMAVVLTDNVSSFALLRLKLGRLGSQLTATFDSETAADPDSGLGAPSPLPAGVSNGWGEANEPAPPTELPADLSPVGSSSAPQEASTSTTTIHSPTTGPVVAMRSHVRSSAIATAVLPDQREAEVGQLVPNSQSQPASVDNSRSAVLDGEATNGAGGNGAVVLKGACLDLNGPIATATVELEHGDRCAIGKAVGRNALEKRLSLMAEATARALTALLPPGYSVVLQHIRHAPLDSYRLLHAHVVLITPSERRSLYGTTPVDGDLSMAAAQTVLSAVNQQIGVVLKTNN